MDTLTHAWVLEVGGRLRCISTDLAEASRAFDDAYRPDVSRTLTRVAIDPDRGQDDENVWVQTQRYRITFENGEARCVQLWPEGEWDMPTARYHDGGGDVMVEAQGVGAAIKQAITTFATLEVMES